MKQLDFKHRFIPSPSLQKHNTQNTNQKQRTKDDKESLTLLLLHGTGGNEDDLIPVGQMISSSAASLLSPRGKVLENGMPRFFKRLAEGVFDIEDLKIRTRELVDFVREASIIYNFDLNKTIAVGFSNGANIAASLLLSYPGTIKGAILFRAMVPFIPDNLPDLSPKQVLLSAGIFDPIVSRNQTEGLFTLLQKGGANVNLKWQQSGHELTEKDIFNAKEWLEKSSI